jgi:hypothetical protein
MGVRKALEVVCGTSSRVKTSVGRLFATGTDPQVITEVLKVHNRGSPKNQIHGSQIMSHGSQITNHGSQICFKKSNNCSESQRFFANPFRKPDGSLRFFFL